METIKILLEGHITQCRNNTDYSDFFIVSQSDAKEQYEKAKEFEKMIEEYLKSE